MRGVEKFLPTQGCVFLKVLLVIYLSFLLFSNVSFASFFSVNPTYEDATDLASGGASLTMATNEGMIFSNPAQLPVGNKLFRWFGGRFSLMPTQGTYDSFAGGLPTVDIENPDTIADFTNLEVEIGAGSTLLTFIMSHFAIVPVALDLNIKAGLKRFGTDKLGSSGLELSVDIENRTGIGIAFAAMPFRWWSLGVTARGFHLIDETIALQAGIGALADFSSTLDSLTTQVEGLADSVAGRKIIAYDLGSLLFFQGEWVDYRIATVVRDVGGAEAEPLTGDGEVLEKPQAIDLGFGVTIHSNDSFVHFAADLKDFQNIYGEPDFKRYAFGVKAHIMKWVALGGGIRHGYPTVGAEVDLLLMRLAYSQYYEVFGDNPLGEKAKYHHVSFAFGTDF